MAVWDGLVTCGVVRRGVVLCVAQWMCGVAQVIVAYGDFGVMSCIVLLCDVVCCSVMARCVVLCCVVIWCGLTNWSVSNGIVARCIVFRCGVVWRSDVSRGV